MESHLAVLFNNLAKRAEGHLLGLSVPIATALFVPVAMVTIWLIVRRIRRGHLES
jgi:uncharacterized membrane-anchored protein